MALVCSNPPMALHPLKVKVDLLYRPVRTYVHSFTDLLWFSLSLSLFEPPDPPAALQTHLTWTRPLYWLFSSCNALSPGIYMNRFLNVFRSLLKCHFLRRLPWVSFKNFVTLFYLHSPFPFFFFFVFFTILTTIWHLYMLFIIFIVHIFHSNISFLRAGIFAVLFTDISLSLDHFLEHDRHWVNACWVFWSSVLV